MLQLLIVHSSSAMEDASVHWKNCVKVVVHLQSVVRQIHRSSGQTYIAYVCNVFQAYMNMYLNLRSNEISMSHLCLLTKEM